MTGLIDFSQDPSSNDVAAAPINFEEGQAARTVNNSMRETMAALARYRDDNAGSLGAPVVGNAVTLSTGQGFAAKHFASGFTISFALQATNTGPLSLNVDGSGPRPWRRQRSFEFAPGDAQALVIHTVAWFPAAGCFVSLSPTIPEPGQIAAFARPEVIPGGWVLCDGRAVSRTAYAALFLSIGTLFGAGDGATTFNVPDLRGRALFGADGGTNRLTGAGGLGGNVANTGGSETVTLSSDQIPSVPFSGTTGNAGGHDHGGGTGAAGAHDHGGGTGPAGGHSHSGTTSTADNHSHSGSTSGVGDHAHGVRYVAASTYGSGNTLGVISIGGETGSLTATAAAGSHSHSVVTDPAGSHNHIFGTDAAPNHAHGITGVGDHAHSITGVGDHAHGFSGNTGGGGGAHPNMPPGLIAVFAIKG
ncbi:phage tail protein [Methylobacterium organophilum]|uniref:Phage tail collar domain-containing protein n=1 Tax=Methylobacterium organophilum TaxID=410 RepID=A0ABQ4TI45_METOR|nr:phage tail protein [Methylobacterium organophilum]GJE29815.1 hypothetical protein LKMONMHP_4701 [Methylobacterium organophilum]